MPEKTRRHKCRWCDYSVQAWRTGRGGKRINGLDRLRDHVMEKHPDEHDAILRSLPPVPIDEHLLREVGL